MMILTKRQPVTVDTYVTTVSPTLLSSRKGPHVFEQPQDRDASIGSGVTQNSGTAPTKGATGRSLPFDRASGAWFSPWSRRSCRSVTATARVLGPQ